MSPLPNELQMDPFEQSDAAVQRDTGRVRTPAEQADFYARVAAAAERKRLEAEQAEVDAAADAHLQRAQERAAERDDGPTEEQRQERADAIAKHMSHPSTLLREVIKSTQAPALDVNARLGVLHNAVVRLAQIILSHTPEAPPHPDHVPAPENVDGEGRIEQQSFEGSDGQVR